MWKSGMGDPACWCRLSTEMHGVWTSGYGVPEAGGKEYQRNSQSLKVVIIQSYIRICKYIRKICIFCLLFGGKYDKVFYCDIL